jgi:hypothetical protein
MDHWSTIYWNYSFFVGIYSVYVYNEVLWLMTYEPELTDNRKYIFSYMWPALSPTYLDSWQSSRWRSALRTVLGVDSWRAGKETKNEAEQAVPRFGSTVAVPPTSNWYHSIIAVITLSVSPHLSPVHEKTGKAGIQSLDTRTSSKIDDWIQIYSEQKRVYVQGKPRCIWRHERDSAQHFWSAKHTVARTCRTSTTKKFLTEVGSCW